MSGLLSILNLPFVLFAFLGSVLGLFVGAIPGLSVSMATALLVSITYTWETTNAIGTIMGLYVVGVFSGALSAILINIPGTPSSLMSTLDGYPMAKKGEAYRALYHAAIASFVGSMVGLFFLWGLAEPVSNVALQFSPMDYFLIAFFGLTTVGGLTAKNMTKGLLSACIGLLVSLVGLDPLVGSPRLTFGNVYLAAGIGTVPVLIGIFGFAEILSVISDRNVTEMVTTMKRQRTRLMESLWHWRILLYGSVLGAFIGALPGVGSPVASLLSYNQVKRMTKKPAVPFGEGAVEGILASETANNGVIGGALIPMLTLAVPGDAVTAIILSVFYIHGLRPGPLFLSESPEMFAAILVGGFLGCLFILLLGLFVAPYISKIILIPKRILFPIITVLCVVGSYAYNNSLFDVAVMFIFGIVGFVMRKRDYPVGPLILGLVLGGMMDSQLRTAVSLASSADHPLSYMFSRPITIVLTIITVLSLITNTALFKRVAGSVFRRTGSVAG
jgi:putative tricarboxylic transport membrane protein